MFEKYQTLILLVLLRLFVDLRSKIEDAGAKAIAQHSLLFALAC